nr:hypothetical protein [Sphingomonas sp. Y57]
MSDEDEDYLFVKAEALAGRAQLRLSKLLLAALVRRGLFSQADVLMLFDQATKDLPPEDQYGLPGSFLHDAWKATRDDLERLTASPSGRGPG